MSLHYKVYKVCARCESSPCWFTTETRWQQIYAFVRLHFTKLEILKDNVHNNREYELYVHRIMRWSGGNMNLVCLECYRTNRVQFYGSAYRKQVESGACKSREFHAYAKRISRVSSEFWLMCACTLCWHSWLTQLAQKSRLALQAENGVIVSAEFVGKQGHEIRPW